MPAHPLLNDKMRTALAIIKSGGSYDDAAKATGLYWIHIKAAYEKQVKEQSK